MNLGGSEVTDAGIEQGLDVSGRVRLMRDGLLHYAAPVLTGVISIVLIPIMLQYLGAEAYGFWIAAQALTVFIGLLDCGFSWSLEREVASALGKDSRSDTARFVQAVGNGYLLIGVAGGVVTALLGVTLSDRFHLTGETQRMVVPVFGMIGAGFLGLQMRTFATAVLQGLRRFDITTALSVGASLLQAVGIIVLLRLGFTLVSVAAWSTLAALLTAVLYVKVIGRLEPSYRFGFARMDWGALRSRAAFALTSRMTDAAVNVFWNSAPVLISLFLGSASVVPYHLGRKFPLALSSVSWRTAAVLFPASSEYAQSRGMPYMKHMLELGMRWILLLCLPAALMLWVFAPDLLEAWLGTVSPEALVIFRLMTLVVLADAVGVGAMFVLWGCGEVRTVLAVLGAAAAVGLGASLGLIPRIGVTGAAWAWLLPSIATSVSFLHFASRRFQFRILDLTRTVGRGLLLPLAACGATAIMIANWVHPGSWYTVIPGSLACGGVYVLTLYLRGAREEERRMIRSALGYFPGVVRFFLRPSKSTSGEK